jgi:hypothetical protein
MDTIALLMLGGKSTGHFYHVPQNSPDEDIFHAVNEITAE